MKTLLQISILVLSLAGSVQAGDAVIFSEDFTVTGADVDVTAQATAAGTNTVSTDAHTYQVVGDAATGVQLDLTAGTLVNSSVAAGTDIWMGTALDSTHDMTAGPITLKVDREATEANSRWSVIHLAEAGATAATIKVIVNRGHPAGPMVMIHNGQVGNTGKISLVEHIAVPGLLEDVDYTYTVKLTQGAPVEVTVTDGGSFTETITGTVDATYLATSLENIYIMHEAISAGVMDNIVVSVDPPISSDPIPANTATDVLRDVVLSWAPGDFAATHNVYVGDSFEDVNTATVPTDPGLDVNLLDLGRLELGKTVYWRVDEVNAAPDYTIFTGDVWSFTVEPVGYPITGSRITAHASSQNSADEGPDKTIDGSGVMGDEGEDHSQSNIDMWRSDTSEPNQAWIQYDFDKVYKLAELKVWNHNNELEMDAGFGIKEALIEVSVDGTEFTPIKTVELAQAAQSSIDILGIVARSLRITAQSNWGGIFQKYGLSEVEILAVPLAAREPMPESGSTDVLPNSVVSWRAGREADQHTVSVSTDMNALADGTAASVSSPTNSLDLTSQDLLLGETYLLARG